MVLHPWDPLFGWRRRSGKENLVKFDMFRASWSVPADEGGGRGRRPSSREGGGVYSTTRRHLSGVPIRVIEVSSAENGASHGPRRGLRGKRHRDTSTVSGTGSRAKCLPSSLRAKSFHQRHQ